MLYYAKLDNDYPYIHGYLSAVSLGVQRETCVLLVDRQPGCYKACEASWLLKRAKTQPTPWYGYHFGEELVRPKKVIDTKGEGTWRA